ncbi:MAG: DUF4834 family protein [Eudoraea sp.]|nr:DUF4834 family protein [Eudoraea sp.]
MTFLKTILIILLIYYLLKILVRWFAPRLFGYAARKAEKHFQETFGAFPDQEAAEDGVWGKAEKRHKRTTKQASKDIGEYIDFEEIE